MSALQNASGVLLQCSLSWLRGFTGNEGLFKGPLLVNGKVKQEIVAVLTNATCYKNAFCTIFSFDSLNEKADGTFWPLIHGLACHGIYVVNEGQTVNHATLSQTTPFEESHHLALLEALMSAHVFSVVKIPHVVRVVRRVSAVKTAKELPTTAEEALVLWVSKVSEAVMHNQESHILLQNKSDVMLKRMQTLDRVVTQPQGILEAVTGGQSLPALLVHYVWQQFKFEDFHFRANNLTHEEALENTVKFSTFAKRNLHFHIEPEMLLSLDSIHLLHTNVVALLARIFEYFEPCSTTFENDTIRRVKQLKPVSQHYSGTQLVEQKVISGCKSKPLLPLRLKVTNTNSGKSGVHPSPSVTKRSTKSSLPVHGAKTRTEERLKRKKVGGNGRHQVSEDTAVQPCTDPKHSCTGDNYLCDIENGTGSNFAEKGQEPFSSGHDLERSFTVNKHHTIDSATKAGLPIIEFQTLLHTEGKTDKLNYSRSIMQVPKSEASCQSRVCLKVLKSNHITVFKANDPMREEGNFEQHLMKNMEEVNASLDGYNVKCIWRQRLRKRQTVCQSGSASLPSKVYLSPQSEPRSTSAQSEVSVHSNYNSTELTQIRQPPTSYSASSNSVQGLKHHGHDSDHPSDSSGNPWQTENSQKIFSAANNEVQLYTLQEKHQHLLREKIEKRLNDRKKALSDQKREKKIQRESKLAAESQSSNEPPSSFIMHNGPDCYVKPSSKSNRQLIRNAICHVCLAGDVNLSVKQQALRELDISSAVHFFILFKHVISFKFRALYSYSEEGKVSKIFGSGPQVVQECMIDRFYKYNCGSKEFSKIHSYSFSLSVDAFTIKQEAWTLRRMKRP